MADYTIPNLNETVAEGVNPPSPNQNNALTMMSGMTEIQNRMNQIQLFRQQMLARQQAGAIMATSPDMDTAMTNMSRDPQVMGFMPDILNTIRQADLTNAQLQGVRQTQGDTAVHALMQTVPSAMTDLSSFDSMMASRLAPLPPAIQQQVKGSVEAMRSALFDGLPSDPAAATSAYRQRWNAMMIGGGFTPDQIAGITGTATVRHMGGYDQPAVQMPGALGGAVTNTPGALPMTLAPTVSAGPYGPGGAQVPAVMGGGLPRSALPYVPLGGNAITGNVAPAAVTAPAGNNAVVPPPRSAPAPTSAPAGKGNALMGPTMAQTAAYGKLGETAGDIQDDMIKNAQVLPSAVKRLDMMTNALSQFQAGGGAEARASLGKAMQALKNTGFGITEDQINDVANSSLPASQLFMKYVKPLVTSEMKDNATGSSTRIRAEVEAYLNMMDATTDPRALMQMLNTSRYNLQVGYDQAQKWPQFKSDVNSGKLKGYDLGDYYSYYDKSLNPKNLPPQTPGGLQLGPEPASKAKGGGQATVTHRYVPGKGIVPVGGQ